MLVSSRMPISLSRAACSGVLGLILVTSAFAQDAAQDPHGVFVERLNPAQPPTDRYGGEVGPSVRKWRPMCGSSVGLTAAQYRTIIDDHQAISAAPPQRAASGTGLNITFSFSGGVPGNVVDALQTAAAYIESSFGDNLTINISVSWANLGGGVLGATGSSESNLDYSVVRDSLVDDMDIDDSIQISFPAGSTLPVRYNEGSSTVTNEDTIAVTWANLRALGGGSPSTVASMTFNSAFNWDFDPSDGISGGAHDIQSVAVHEIGHAMGFVSDVDDDCGGGNHTMSTLDMFRFRNSDGCCDYDPDSLAEFTTTPRLVDCNSPNDSHTTDLINVEYRMSDGSPSQASHFRFSVAAIMDPNIASGESFYPDFFREPDMAIFDAIGWDTPVEPDFIDLPVFDQFPDEQLDGVTWLGIEGGIGSTRGVNEPTPEFSLKLAGSSAGGQQVRTAFLDTDDVADLVLNFYYQRGGIDDPPEAGDELIIEYWDGSGSWVEVTSFDGTGVAETEFTFISIDMPGSASHPEFRLRLRVESSEPGNDNWFVDNLCLGSAGFCADPFECVNPADCDDGIACTQDSCVDGLCVNTPIDALCDDGIGCTVDDCDTAIGCSNTPDNSLCDDGVACTTGVCNLDTDCVFFTSDLLCDDGDPCTEDTCDAVMGCLNPPNEICGGLSLVLEDGSAACGQPGVGLCELIIQMPTSADRLLSVGFVNISTDAPGGFNQIPGAMGGTDTAPTELFLELFPELVCDTFVTIGLEMVPTGTTDNTTLDPDFDSDSFNCADGCGSVSGGWFNADPPSGQGDASSYPGNRVLVGNFAVPAGSVVSGDIVVFINDGMNEIPLSFECATGGCPADSNGDGVVDAADLAGLLGAWGPDPSGTFDLTGDGVVDAADLAGLLGAWGPCV